MTLPTFNESTTAAEVAETFADQIRGKNVLVTGTSLGGIGAETALQTAKYANLVIITGYNSDRLRKTEEAIKKEVPTANLRLLTLDLLSLDSVRAAAAEVNAYPEPIHVLINNAASGEQEFKISKDGFEHQLAASHLGPFLFTKLILNKVLAARTDSYTPRVIFVSSAMQGYGSLDFDTVRKAKPEDAEKYVASNTYIGVKCANVMVAAELTRRAEGKVKAFSLHPGLIFTNMCQVPGNTAVLKGMDLVDESGQPRHDHPQHKWKSIPQGAATTLTAAFDTRLNDADGGFLFDCNLANEQAKANHDPARTQKLWELTEELLGDKFTI